jgi:hypothetical protein
VTNSESWLDAQHRFASGYLSGGSGSDRRRVKFRWWTTSSRSGVRGSLVGLLWTAVRGQRLSTDGLHVALYELDAAVGARPFLAFDVHVDTFDAASGRSLGVVVGDAVPGGALVLEARGDPVFPLWIPTEPDDDAPGWTEVESA